MEPAVLPGGKFSFAGGLSYVIFYSWAKNSRVFGGENPVFFGFWAPSPPRHPPEVSLHDDFSSPRPPSALLRAPGRDTDEYAVRRGDGPRGFGAGLHLGL